MSLCLLEEYIGLMNAADMMFIGIGAVYSSRPQEK
jgi:hypothetical protein